MERAWTLSVYGSSWSGKSQMPFFLAGHIWKSPGELAS